MLEDLSNQVLALQTLMSDHIDSNNKKFAQYDMLVKNLTGYTPETVTSKVKEMTGMTDNVTVNATPDAGASMMAPAMMAAMSNKGGGGDGLFGGGGLISGLLLGTLLRNGNLLGGDGAAGAVSQPQANMSIMSTLGDIKQAVAVGTAQMEASQAQQSSTLQAQMSSIAAATVAQISGVKDVVNQNAVAIMQMINQINTNITNDGEKTRALITSNYQDTLNRQLTEANNALIELRTEQRQRATEVNMTQIVNQNQQQQQSQQQMGNIWTMLHDMQQNIRATNQAINIGNGSLTANPANTNTNTRVN